MESWATIKKELEGGHRVVLLYVLHSEGSSPGRQGFKMMVSGSGLLHGSIGGGFMEHKLVEMCKNDLLRRSFSPFIKRQIHQTDIPKDRSGMICSGEQTIAFYPLSENDIPIVSTILESSEGIIELNTEGIIYFAEEKSSERFELNISDTEKWTLKEHLGYKPPMHIVGGGHVGLALSKFAYELGFQITIYDDRDGLNTMELNRFAETIRVSGYDRISEYITDDPKAYVVLMSFGYRTDKTVLKQILKHDFKYLGMMGSKEKVRTLFKELSEEGVDREKLKNIHSPIGLNIHSRTPEEIAISILAEITMIRNKDGG